MTDTISGPPCSFKIEFISWNLLTFDNFDNSNLPVNFERAIEFFILELVAGTQTDGRTDKQPGCNAQCGYLHGGLHNKPI